MGLDRERKLSARIGGFWVGGRVVVVVVVAGASMWVGG